jgi:hypothetical protein
MELAELSRARAFTLLLDPHRIDRQIYNEPAPCVYTKGRFRAQHAGTTGPRDSGKRSKEAPIAKQTGQKLPNQLQNNTTARFNFFLVFPRLDMSGPTPSVHAYAANT